MIYHFLKQTYVRCLT